MCLKMAPRFPLSRAACERGHNSLACGAWWSHGRHRHGQRRVATGGLPVGGDRLPLGVGRRPLRVCGERRLCLLTTATDHGHTLY